jgi:hypothetical protein
MRVIIGHGQAVRLFCDRNWRARNSVEAQRFLYWCLFDRRSFGEEMILCQQTISFGSYGLQFSPKSLQFGLIIERHLTSHRPYSSDAKVG